jgi:hypothetical protein
MRPDIIGKTQKTKVTFERQADGKIRATSTPWDEPKVILRGEALEARWLDGVIQVVRKALEHDEANPVFEPYDRYGYDVIGASEVDA